MNKQWVALELQRSYIPRAAAEKIYEQLWITNSFENLTICGQVFNNKSSKNRVQSLRISKENVWNSLLCYYWTGPDVQAHQVSQAHCRLHHKFIWNFNVISEGQYWLKIFPFQKRIPWQMGIFLPSFAWCRASWMALTSQIVTGCIFPSQLLQPGSCQSDLTLLHHQWILPCYL